MTAAPAPVITVGELCARFIESCGTRAAFGVISIHNMPILDALHRRAKVRFISARGEAGACNMADAYARVTGLLGVCITSTGTGSGNAAGAMVEALTAGTPLLHLTGQIDSEFIDRDLGFIHEHPAQLAMLQSVSKAAFRIRDPQTALATLREAARLAFTPPCGPVSIEIPIDIQASALPIPESISPLPATPLSPPDHAIALLATRLRGARRPILWLGGGARGAGRAVTRLLDMGWVMVSSVQGRGIVPEDHPASLGSFNLLKPAEAFYATCDAMLAVGTRLRSNETLRYQLKLPTPLYRIDANALAENRGYASDIFVQGDAEQSLDALADMLEGQMSIDPALQQDLARTRAQCEAVVEGSLGPYQSLKRTLMEAAGQHIWWVRDITLSNSMWGNRAPVLNHPRAGVHALGGGIGQGLAMAIGAAVANTEHRLGRRTLALVGDGGVMLNLGELACAAQERADIVLILMNDRSYGVIRNIQDDIYGGRRCYVDLHTPQFCQLCQSMGVAHFKSSGPSDIDATFRQALASAGPVVLEIDMHSWGPFAAKFAGPMLKKD